MNELQEQVKNEFEPLQEDEGGKPLWEQWQGEEIF